jgi:hypothetical protein
MAAEEDSQQAGIIVPEDGDNVDHMNTLVKLSLLPIQLSKRGVSEANSAPGTFHSR